MTEAGQEEQSEEAYGRKPPPEPAADPVEQIKKLVELREQGVLSEEEFAAEKKRLLGL